ncbi:MAG: 30S ribosomal protein S12 methylthiotransferase RimO [Tissierellia bacterium]|nr:30S ribosomal protein S12 methylthiotransferase RimO [Tissierellia bacterium]
MKKVAMVTLGCSKNDVDTQIMKGLLDKEKYENTLDIGEAQVVVVNTCGFIDAAKEESIETILSLAQLKEEAHLEKLLLAGCLAQRYPEELLKEIPEADGIIGTGNLKDINQAIDAAYQGQGAWYTDNMETDHIEDIPRTDIGVTEYVKISEGCNNTCSYCIIPQLRGKNRSRPIEKICQEVQALVQAGTREVILIAQNLTDYGIDLYGKRCLADLLKELGKIKDLKWIRLLYAYPDYFDRALIDQMRSNPKIVPYIDIPLQHISDRILGLMGRKTSKKEIISLITQLRRDVPNIVIRSTFLVGFPQETEEDFQEILDFLKAYPLDRVGSFIYSREEGTRAAQMEGQIPREVQEKRQATLMALQEEISRNRLTSRIGQEYEVLITDQIEEGLYTGRTALEAPEIDGLVYVKSQKPLDLDQFYRLKITDSLTHDLEGDLL